MKKLYIIPDYRDFAPFLELAEEYDACFEYNDFYEPALLDDEKKCQERIDFYRATGRDTANDTMHGAFFDVTVHSDDSLLREVSVKRVRQSMEVAKALGLRGVVFHTGTIPNFKGDYYSNNWVSRNKQFWTELCREYAGIEVFMENMFDMNPELLLRLGQEMREVKNFGICLDYAHARIFGGKPEEWLEQLAPFVRHMHINDNDGERDLHNAVGDGVVDWQVFDKGIRQKGIVPTVLIETRSIEKQRESLAYMQEYSIYPFPVKRGGQ